jgi:hypothetical protein
LLDENDKSVINFFEESIKIYNEVKLLPQVNISNLNFCYHFPKYFDLHKKVTDNGGLVMIENFLPDKIANSIEQILTSMIINKIFKKLNGVMNNNSLEIFFILM